MSSERRESAVLLKKSGSDFKNLFVIACDTDIYNLQQATLCYADYQMSNRLWQWVAMRGWLIACGALLTVWVLINVTSLHHKGLTTDEPLHYQYRLSRVEWHSLANGSLK